MDACDLFICTSVLERVERPWIASKNIIKSVKNKGMIFLTVPWVWEYDGFPKDYWRMSPESLEILFEGTRLCDQLYVTYPDCKGYNSIEEIPCLNNKYFTGDCTDGDKYKIRMHPLVQIFQMRQKNA